MNQELINEVNELIKSHLKKGYTSVSYALMLDGELVVNDSLGTLSGRSKEKATTDCTYNVASISKVYTTAAVMKLVEEGKLDLDTPVVQYLPDFKTLNEGYEKMTLRQCLSHSCALPGTQWVDFSVSDQSEVDYYKEALTFYSKSHLKAAPGRYSVYCNDGFTIAEMCVAAVCEEKSFSEFCRIHLTDPIEAYSSRFARSYNPDYPMIAQGKGPKEIVASQGLGGLTTSMKDLALFGCQFLPEYGKQPVHLLKETSIQEMMTSHGKTFLRKDNYTTNFGLGWDSVNFQHPDYDLGEGGLRKGGASFQFGTNFMVFPKYNAVVCMSQTYDCDLNTRDLSLQILALCLLKEKNINISRFKVVPESLKTRYSGDYLDSYTQYHASFHGTRLYLFKENSRGKKEIVYSSMGYTGRGFEAEDGHKVYVESVGRQRYMLSEYQGYTAPLAQQIQDGPKLSSTWKKRLGKKYVNISMTWYDEVIGDMNAGFALKPMSEHEGVIQVAFACAQDVTDSAVKPLSAQVATSFVDTPSNASRDLISLLFSRRGKAEICDTASYTYQDTDSLKVYDGMKSIEKAAEQAKEAGSSIALKVDADVMPLKSVKEIGEKYRILLLDEEMSLVCDSLMSAVDEKTGEPESFKETKKGYLLLAAKPEVKA